MGSSAQQSWTRHAWSKMGSSEFIATKILQESLGTTASCMASVAALGHGYDSHPYVWNRLLDVTVNTGSDVCPFTASWPCSMQQTWGSSGEAQLIQLGNVLQGGWLWARDWGMEWASSITLSDGLTGCEPGSHLVPEGAPWLQEKRVSFIQSSQHVTKGMILFNNEEPQPHRG